MIQLTINGTPLEVPEGWTVLQAAGHIGVTIPTLCHHKDLTPFGGCRLCVVEVKGARLPATACNLPVSARMDVQTETPRLVEYRQAVLKMLLASFYDAGYKRQAGGFGLDEDSQFAYWVRFYGIDMRSAMASHPQHAIDSDPNPYVWVDMNKCIQCTRCVRACAEIQGRFVWAQAYRGYKSRIVAGADSTMLASRCESCGACVAYCPTGALDNKLSVNLGRADRLVRTTCAYCGVGCQLDLNVKDEPFGGSVLRVTSTPEAPVNGLHLCLKGRYGYEFIHKTERLTRPRVREYLLNEQPRPRERGKWVDVDWDTALGIAARGLHQACCDQEIDRVGVLGSGKYTNEENYLLNKFARQVLHTNNIDCAAHAIQPDIMEGVEKASGWPAMSNTFEDIATQARSALVIGSPTTEQHPVFGVRLRQAALHRRLKLVVADSEFPNMAEYASLYLRHQPEAEAALVLGLIHAIIENNWYDQDFIDAHTQGFAAFRASLAPFTLEWAAQASGLEAQDLRRAAELLTQHRPAALIWSTGIGRQADPGPVVQALVHLQLLLGGVGVPGGGLNPLPSQNNLQGACDMGVHPAYLPGYQPVSDPAARQRFEAAWGAPVPAAPGMPAMDMLEAASGGELKALYLLGEDLLAGAASDPEQSAFVRRSLAGCEFTVLQEILPSDTARYADVLLPGVSFAEKAGTFTSAERRIQLVRAAIAPLEGARLDLHIIAELARRILARSNRQLSAPYAGWQDRHPAQVMEEIAALTPIYSGVTYTRLEDGAQLHWPVDGPEHPGTTILPLAQNQRIAFQPVEAVYA